MEILNSLVAASCPCNACNSSSRPVPQDRYRGSALLASPALAGSPICCKMIHLDSEGWRAEPGGRIREHQLLEAVEQVRRAELRPERLAEPGTEGQGQMAPPKNAKPAHQYRHLPRRMAAPIKAKPTAAKATSRSIPAQSSFAFLIAARPTAAATIKAIRLGWIGVAWWAPGGCSIFTP